MRNVLLSLAVASTVIIQGSVPVLACGDKMLMLGRGVRFQSRHSPHAAAVLVYLPAAAARGAALADPKLESALTEAGHRVRSVTTKEELSQALRTGQYDVVIAELGEAPDLQQALMTDASHPVVLPAVYLLAPAGRPQTKADTTKATKDFSVVLQVPDRVGHYCAVVDKAMELKLKREKSVARQ